MVNANEGVASDAACGTDANSAHCFDHDGDEEAADDADTGATWPVKETAGSETIRAMTRRGLVLAKDTSQDYDLTSAGVKYSDGPMAVSLTHMMGEADDGTEADVTMFSLAYTLAPGVSSKTSIISGEQGTAEGTAFVTGITVSF